MVSQMLRNLHSFFSPTLTLVVHSLKPPSLTKEWRFCLGIRLERGMGTTPWTCFGLLLIMTLKNSQMCLKLQSLILRLRISLSLVFKVSF